MKILYLTTVIPNNVKTGGEIVSRQYIEALRTSHEVSVLAYKRKGEAIDLDRDDHIIEERIIETQASRAWLLIWMMLSLFSSRTYSSQKYYSKKYIKTVEEFFANDNFELVIVDHSQLSWILCHIPNSIPIIFCSHNVEYLVYRELSSQARNFLKKNIYARESKLMRLEEQRLLKRSKQVWVLSDSDKKVYKKLFGKDKLFKIINVPGGFKQLVECEKKYDIGILGTWTWESNKKGLEWFLREVLPLIDAQFSIALGGKGSLVYRGAYSSVNTLGIVDDAQKFLSSCRLLVVPTIAGGGIQIKTLDAISTNRPVITTSIGIRGINTIPDSVFVENDSNKFASKINELLTIKENDDVGFSWTNKRREDFLEYLAACVMSSH
jgi:hypothetical protein